MRLPGHDHSIVGNMVAGDLNSHKALWLWNCPVTNEELDIWHHINEYVLFTFIFHLILPFKLSFSPIFIHFNFISRAFDMYETIEKGWVQDRDFLGNGIASEMFDAPCLDGARSFARRKHL